MELFKIYVPMKFGSDFNGSDLGALSIKNRFINDNDIQIKVQGNPTYTSNLKNLDIVIEM